MTEPATRSVIRDRWRKWHRRLGVPAHSEDTDITPAGLGRRVSDLSTRIVVLPRDPRATRVEFNDEMWEWWNQLDSTPFGASLIWHKQVPTVDAAASVRSRKREWETYVAVHRHGRVEAGTSNVYEIREKRCFRLTHTVGLLWTVLHAQSHVLRRIEASGPWQVTLVLHETGDALLGDLAEGWQSPGRGATFIPACREPHVVIREELDEWPDQEGTQVRDVAYRLGGRIEDAWGVRQRRFLASKGDLEGEADLRRWSL